MKEKKYDFNDMLIQPAATSNINSRSEVNPFNSDGLLPLITAPMDTVVNRETFKHFIYGNKIRVCFPREKQYTPSSNKNLVSSISLDEFIKIYLEDKTYDQELMDELTFGHHVLIDIANGHLLKLTKAIKDAKKLYGDKLYIMAGNVANPKTYVALSRAGCSECRVGIGNGAGCLTTKQTAIGYPSASLIHDCYKESLNLKKPALIIADGGMKDYSDIIKAIALGADQIMVGSIFNKALESCGPTYFLKRIKINQQSKFANWAFKKGFKLTKKFRGMSTKEVQKEWGKKVIKTSEGIVTYRPVEYTLSQWTENFESYLRSAMSYTNSKTLKEFRENAEAIFITENAYKRFNK